MIRIALFAGLVLMTGVPSTAWCLAAGQPQTLTPRMVSPTDTSMRELHLLDTDSDGVLSVAELQEGQWRAYVLLSLDWDACDLDADGNVDALEYARAMDEAGRVLAAADQEYDVQAEDTLARAVTVSLLLGRLANDAAYNAEIVTLRTAVADFNDDEAVVTYVLKYPDRYPRLTPLVRTWVRYYPVRPQLRRLVPRYSTYLDRTPSRLRPTHPGHTHPGQTRPGNSGPSRRPIPVAPVRPFSSRPARRPGRPQAAQVNAPDSDHSQ